jgi:hypothetical protein
VVESLLNQPSYEDMPNSELPNLSIMMSSVEIDDTSDQHPGSNSSPHGGVDPNTCNELSKPSQTGVDPNPCDQTDGSNNFPDVGVDDQSHNDSSVMLPEFAVLIPEPEKPGNAESPSLQASKEKNDIIISKYCVEQRPGSLPSTGTPVIFRIPERAPPTPDSTLTRAPPSTGHSSYGLSQLTSAFYKNPEMFNFEIETLQNLLRLATPTSLHYLGGKSFFSSPEMKLYELFLLSVVHLSASL